MRASLVFLISAVMLSCSSRVSQPTNLDAIFSQPVSYKRPVASQPAKTVSTPANRLLKFATRFVGQPYRYGGTSVSGFDCSGYVQYVYRAANIKLPRTSKEQAKAGRWVSLYQVQPGDLFYFANSKGRVHHVGIAYRYTKDGWEMLHVSSNHGVVITNLTRSDYWRRRLRGARRFW